jgi:hypothetical protein
MKTVKNARKPPWYARPGMFLVGLALLSPSLLVLLKGAAFYQNYWGGVAFAPIGVVVGAFAMYLATFGWKALESREKSRK